MAFSSYQIGRLIAQMRKAGLLEAPPASQASGVDRVELTSRGTSAGRGTLRLEPEAAPDEAAPDEAAAPAVPKTGATPEVFPTQVMRLIEELRAAHLMKPGTPAPAPGQALGRAPLRVLPARPGGGTVQVEAPAPLAEVPLSAVREATPPAAPVQAELERRAGSFMQPPLPPEPPAPPIPKVKRQTITLPHPRPRAEGD